MAARLGGLHRRGRAEAVERAPGRSRRRPLRQDEGVGSKSMTISGLLLALLAAGPAAANSVWDELPTPLMRLADMGVAADAELIAGVLTDPRQPPSRRYWAALGLAQLGSRAHIPDLIRLLDDPVAAVQEGALAALQHLPSEAAIGPLCDKSASSHDPDLRRTAIDLLSGYPGREATACIVAFATRDEEADAPRLGVLHVLAADRDPDGEFEGLRALLDDGDAGRRALAAAALARLYRGESRMPERLRLARVLATALLDHRMDLWTFRTAAERFEKLTDTAIRLDPFEDIEYFGLDSKRREIIDGRLHAWLRADAAASR